MQELLTASDREYAPTGRAWAPPTHRIEDDPFAHVLIDEAQDLTPMQWRMVGRRGRTASWTIVGDPAQSSWPVPDGVRRGPRRRARGQGASTSSTSRRTTATPPRSTSTPRRTPSASASTPTCPTAVRSTGDRAAGGHRRRATSRPPTREAVADVAGRVARHGRRSWCPVARRSEVNAWLASWPELAEDAPAPGPRSTPRCAPSGEDRVVVLTGLDTKGLEFDGIVVVAPRGDRGRSRSTGRATLYVVLTRATQLLTTIS